MNRTGVKMENVRDFYNRMNSIQGITPVGLHCYDGDRHEKSFEERVLVLGGSPSFPCYISQLTPAAYVSPGTVILYDAGYTAQFPDLPFLPGASILTRVVSHPEYGVFTLDAGYKAISAEQSQYGILLGVEHAKEMFQSEEHWTYKMQPGFEHERLGIGRELYILPWHICPTLALHEKAYIVVKQSLAGVWPITARRRSFDESYRFDKE